MRYSTLLQFWVAPETKAAIAEAAASRGLKVSEWLRNAAATGLAMDDAVNIAMDTTEEASR
jgi:hypothetical protein